jgi:hypothetical protein
MQLQICRSAQTPALTRDHLIHLSWVTNNSAADVYNYISYKT